MVNVVRIQTSFYGQELMSRHQFAPRGVQQLGISGRGAATTLRRATGFQFTR
jgi:hypothetical protein